MPLSSLTAAQQALLASAIFQYVSDQFAKGNASVYVQIRTATTPQITTALTPYLNAGLAGAQAAQSGLAAQHAAQTAAVNQAVTDWQAVVANLT